MQSSSFVTVYPLCNVAYNVTVTESRQRALCGRSAPLPPSLVARAQVSDIKKGERIPGRCRSRPPGIPGTREDLRDSCPPWPLIRAKVPARGKICRSAPPIMAAPAAPCVFLRSTARDCRARCVWGIFPPFCMCNAFNVLKALKKTLHALKTLCV